MRSSLVVYCLKRNCQLRCELMAAPGAISHSIFVIWQAHGLVAVRSVSLPGAILVANIVD
jgi:hypothetical protein